MSAAITVTGGEGTAETEGLNEANCQDVNRERERGETEREREIERERERERER